MRFSKYPRGQSATHETPYKKLYAQFRHEVCEVHDSHGGLQEMHVNGTEPLE